MAGLRDLPQEEFERILQRNTGDTSSTYASDFTIEPGTPASFDMPDWASAPNTQAALAETSSNLNQFTIPTEQQGARLGVALDRESGLPFTKQLMLELNRRPADKFRELQRQYGAINVQMSPDGNFVVRNQVNSATGRPQDLLVKSRGITKESFVAILPEIVGGVIGSRLGISGAGKLGGGAFAKFLGGLVGMAGVGQSAGALKDVAVRSFGGDPIEVDEIAKERAKSAGIDFAIGGALGSVLKVGSLVVSPFATSSAALVEERAAVTALERLAGETMPRTPGEMTGSQILLRTEAQFAKRPGSSMAFEKINQAKDTFIRGLQNRFLGIPAKTPPSEVAGLLPSQEAVGQQALGTLGSQALQLEGAIAKAAQVVETTGTAEAQAVGRVTIPSRIDTTVLGAVQQRSVTRSFTAFKAKAAQAYEAFLSKPEISSRIVSVDDLAKEAKAMSSKLPAVEVTKKVQAYDQYGNPTEVAKTAVERLDTFIAPKVKATIDRLAGLSGGKTSINDLKQIRTSIDDAIAEGIAIPGTDVKQLIGLREMVNKATRDGLDGLPNGKALLAEWDSLNQNYRTGISRFDRVAIRQMLVKPGESGSVGHTAIVERTFGNSAGAKDVYTEYKAFFGQQSVEFRALQLAIAEDAIGAGALKPGTTTIDGRRLLANLNSMRSEVADEILGVNQVELRRIGEALGAAQGKLDVNELAQLAKSKSLTAEKLTELMSAESTRATAYRNRLVAASAKGALTADKIQPAEFVRYMAGRASEPEVVEVLGRFHDQPELLQSIRTLAGEEFLANAGVGTKLSPAAIARTFGDRERQKVWKAMLGDETYTALNNFAIALRPTEAATQTFKATGGIQAGQEISEIFGRGEMAAIPGILVRAIGTFIYAGPGRILANNLVTPATAHQFINGVVASEPFLRYLTERFGPEAAESAVDAMRPAMDAAFRNDMRLRGQVPLSQGERINLRNLSPAEFETYLERNKQ